MQKFNLIVYRLMPRRMSRYRRYQVQCLFADPQGSQQSLIRGLIESYFAHVLSKLLPDPAIADFL